MPRLHLKSSLLSLAVLSSLVGFGQSRDATRYIEYGQQAMSEFDFLGATQYFEKAIESDPDYALKADYVYDWLAQSYHRLNNYEAALEWYGEISDKWPNYQPDHVLLQQALLLKSLGRYQQAKALFAQFNPKTSADQLRKTFELVACDSATAALEKDSIMIHHLGKEINSPDSEFGPRWINDSTIHFSYLKPRNERDFGTESPKDYKARIALAVGKDTAWSYQQTLLQDVDRTIHVANGTVNADHSKMYYSRCQDLDGCKIFQATASSNGWINHQPVTGGEVNLEGANSTHPFLTSYDNEVWMLFASNRPGGIGEMDIYATQYMDSGWTSAQLVNGNSPGNEVTPAFDPIHNQLFFSTDFHSTFGGYDIVRQDSAGIFGNGQLINPGLPINSRFNDLYYTPDTTKPRALLVSNREDSFSREEFPCCNDLYLVSIDTGKKIIEKVVEEPAVVNFNVEDLVPVKLYFHNDRPDQDSWDTISSLAYNEWYDQYIVLKQSYIAENANTGNTAEATKAVDDILYFWDNQLIKGWTDLQVFTEQLLLLLKQGKRMQLVVKGFASPLHQTNYNVNLTLRRISSLEQYFQQLNGGELFKPYFEINENGHAKLEIVRAPFGEYTADQNVSDDFYNERASVYSTGAALERRVEIIEAREIMDDDSVPRINVSRATHNFGILSGDTILNTQFELWNKGSATMTLDSVEVGCGCTTPEFNFTTIPVEQSGTVTITWDTQGLKGFEKRSIYIYYNGLANPFELHVTGEIRREDD